MAPTLQSTDVATKTVTEVQADGSILKTITTTTTTKFTDGTTRQRIKTQKEITPAVHTSHTGVKAIKANPYEFGYDVSKSTAPKAAVTTSNEFIQQCLDEHNKFRAMHHAPPLVLNNKLSKIAQSWANQLAKDEKMYHSSYDFGENLFWCTEDKPGYHAVKKWYDEIKYWDWNKMAGTGEGQIGHFTQLIWKRSKEIGVAAAYSKDGHLFVVVEYNPPGNYSNDVFTKTDTKAKADGSILTITTTTNIKKYSDGSTVTKVKKQTETTPAGYSSNTGLRAIKGNPYEFGYDASQSMAAKAAITTSKEFKKHCLDEHNKLRAMHHAPPLKLNLELSKIAQSWANKLAKDEKMCYSTYEFGENIYSCTVDRPSASADAVKAWYDGIKYWDWKKMSGNGKGETGHFTQLIWKRSKEIGIAAAYSKDGRLFVVVEYNPPGNFTGRYWENVLPK